MTLLEQLQALAPLAAAATPGPWRTETDFENWLPMILSDCGHIATIEDINFGSTRYEEKEAHPDQPEDNAAFIAASRNLLTQENVAQLIAGAAALAIATCEVCLGTGKLDDDLAWDEPGTEDRCSKCPYCQAPAPAVSGWASVADGLPDMDGPYLAIAGRSIDIVHFYTGNRYFLVDAGLSPDNVTHWQPLPALPNA